MKKYICILASAALLVACEQKNETATPAASPAESTENNTTVVNPPASTDTTTNTTPGHHHPGGVHPDGDHEPGSGGRTHDRVDHVDDDRSFSDSVIPELNSLTKIFPRRHGQGEDFSVDRSRRSFTLRLANARPEFGPAHEPVCSVLHEVRPLGCDRTWCAIIISGCSIRLGQRISLTPAAG